MATSQSKSFVECLGDGVTTTFSVPFPYISPEHVQVRVDDVVTAYTFLTGSSIEISPAPADQSTVIIQRVTPDDPLVDFSVGNQFSRNKLLTAYQQILYVAQEAFDEGTTIQVNVTADFTDIVNTINTNTADLQAQIDAYTTQFEADITAAEVDFQAQIAELQAFPPDLQGFLNALDAQYVQLQADVDQLELDSADIQARLTALESFDLPAPEAGGVQPPIPTNSLPADASTDVAVTTSLTIDPVTVEAPGVHVATRWEVATDDQFTNVVHDVTSDTDLLNHDFTGTNGTEYFWRAYTTIEVPGAEGSVPTSYTTVAFEGLFSLREGAGTLSSTVTKLSSSANGSGVSGCLMVPWGDFTYVIGCSSSGFTLSRTHPTGPATLEDTVAHVPAVGMNCLVAWRPDLLDTQIIIAAESYVGNTGILFFVLDIDDVSHSITSITEGGRQALTATNAGVEGVWVTGITGTARALVTYYNGSNEHYIEVVTVNTVDASHVQEGGQHVPGTNSFIGGVITCFNPNTNRGFTYYSGRSRIVRHFTYDPATMTSPVFSGSHDVGGFSLFGQIIMKNAVNCQQATYNFDGEYILLGGIENSPAGYFALFHTPATGSITNEYATFSGIGASSSGDEPERSTCVWNPQTGDVVLSGNPDSGTAANAMGYYKIAKALPGDLQVGSAQEYTTPLGIYNSVSSPGARCVFIEPANPSNIHLFYYTSKSGDTGLVHSISSIA